MPSVDLHGDWPLVGRAEELHELVGVIEQGVGAPDRPAGAVVVAPAGVGKTRLLREARASAERLGLLTAMAIATRSASEIPYAAVAHLAPRLPTSTAADRVAWFNEFTDQLRTADGPRPVLLVDDAQWLDAGSAALVLHLALTRAATTVVAVRRGERVPDPVSVLWRDGLALRIDVQPFSRREIEALIDTVLTGDVSSRTTRRLAEVSQGNVLFARELVIGAADAGSLRQRDGIWHWDGEVVLAPRLVDAVGRRLEGLDGRHREALALLAVGEPLPLQVAEQAVAPAAIARLDTQGLVRIDGRGASSECRLAHPLYGEVLLSQVGRVERRRLTGVLADLWRRAPTGPRGPWSRWRRGDSRRVARQLPSCSRRQRCSQTSPSTTCWRSGLPRRPSTSVRDRWPRSPWPRRTSDRDGSRRPSSPSRARSRRSWTPRTRACTSCTWIVATACSTSGWADATIPWPCSNASGSHKPRPPAMRAPRRGGWRTPTVPHSGSMPETSPAPWR